MRQLAGLVLLLLFFTSCETDEYTQTGNNDVGSLVFYSLTTDKDTIAVGETAQVTAWATGYNMTYAWSATAGTIFGSGNEISFSASCSCQGGITIITCTVTDGHNASDSKEVSIVIQ